VRNNLQIRRADGESTQVVGRKSNGCVSGQFAQVETSEMCNSKTSGRGFWVTLRIGYT
jgi:hypothetical protein